MKKYKVLISGAGGRDFSNYLVYFKNNPNYEVVAFTAAQIPGIEKRNFPKQLAKGKSIPIYSESKLPMLIKKLKIDFVFLSYSDLNHQYVMDFASRVLSAGANFGLLGAKDTYVKSKKPVIAVTAVRTGSGKSQTSRAIAEIFRKKGKKVVGVRHSMPYGNLLKQTSQRFEKESDFRKHKTTIEEEEEYQPWINHGFVIYAGFDYKEILGRAEKEADVIVFDGGNNDISFIKPDLLITVVDPHRAGDELNYYPGFVNFLMADVIVVNKIDSAVKKDIEIVLKNIKKYNPKAKVILAKSKLLVNKPRLIRGKMCAVVGDGPTLSHGGMSYGAGTIAVKRNGGKFVNPRKYAVGSIKDTFEKFPHLTNEIPAMGYSRKQIKDLEKTINRVPCDVVVDGTPANLKGLISVNKPMVEVDYELGDSAVKDFEKLLKRFK
jgi:predicted GTPase